MTATKLLVVIDGEVLADEEARNLWELFSAHMDANRGDFEGFARSQGMASATTGLTAGVPTLTLSSKSAPPPARPEPGASSRRGGKRGPRGRRKR